MYNGTIFILLIFKFIFYFMIFLFCFIYYNFYFCLDNDYYYGGSMRDLNNGHGRPRKASSVSHLGELIAWIISLI